MRRALAWIALLGVLSLPLFALAQDDELDPAEARAETFVAAEPGAQTENIPGGLLMVIAYDVVWVLMLLYVLSLGFRLTRTQRDLDRLRQDIAGGADEG